MRAINPSARRSRLLVSKDNHFGFIQAVEIIKAADEQVVDRLQIVETICKASNGAPNIGPLFSPNARQWLSWYLGRQHARWLFAGTDSSGRVRLTTAYDEEFAVAQAPHPDCVCQKYGHPYSLLDVDEQRRCREDESQIVCL